MNTKITAKEFFLELGAMVSLYAGVIALLNLLFRVINTAFPKVQGGYMGYYYAGNPISFPVATLIIVTPLFLGLTWFMQKSRDNGSIQQETGFRKWLVYITLFLAGIVLAVDLITLLYQFIDGQDLTKGFLLKVLSVFVVAGSVFTYFLQDLRNKLSQRSRMFWRIFAAVLVAGSIVLGFSVIGSPATQRAYRYDSERVMALQGIQSQIIYYYQQKGGLPGSIADLKDSISGYSIPLDPQTREPYEYKLIGQSAKAFELCANFSMPTPPYMGQMYGDFSITRPTMGGGISGGDNWDHDAGRQCFVRTIDPDFYPVIKR